MGCKCILVPSTTTNQLLKKGGIMSLIKKSDWPSLVNGAWMSDFFDNDRFFDSALLRTQSVPAVNVTETEKGFEIEVAAPGLSRKDFKVSVDNRILTISSEKKN